MVQFDNAANKYVNLSKELQAQGILHRGDSNITILVYVDDIIIIGDPDAVTKIGASGLILSQEKYVKDLLKKADMENCKPCHTPLPSSVKFSYFGGFSFNNHRLYWSVVGSLQYLIVTRPKLSYCVGKVSQFMQNSLDEN
ncbi:uncharacterized protein LOC107636706 [Arachis ipaensis]|uniref:uncharacterized protein LOC107636706 n=1 Tax=Arachis ipaensis TaxID=130454 RepID=UPI0007AEF561|nr:uncharacterized protein LOC107636706 [Arachis ipaensis]